MAPGKIPGAFFGQSSIHLPPEKTSIFVKGFQGEGIARMVKRNGYTPAIGVTVSLVAPNLGAEEEAITHQRTDEVSGRQAAELAVINSHRD